MTLTAQTNENHEIRVFISSTFRGTHPERDYLVSHVFWLCAVLAASVKVELTEIDLRWAVTKDESEPMY